LRGQIAAEKITLLGTLGEEAANGLAFVRGQLVEGGGAARDEKEQHQE